MGGSEFVDDLEPKPNYRFEGGYEDRLLALKTQKSCVRCSGVVFIHDYRESVEFLLDTGAETASFIKKEVFDQWRDQLLDVIFPCSKLHWQIQRLNQVSRSMLG